MPRSLILSTLLILFPILTPSLRAQMRERVMRAGLAHLALHASDEGLKSRIRGRIREPGRAAAG